MAAHTLLLIILAGIIALCAAAFQYFYKSRIDKRLKILFSILRFLSLFALLLILVNPKINRISFFSEKPVLAIAVDNSASIANLDQEGEVRASILKIADDPAIKERFDVDLYHFGESLKKGDSLDFKDTRTDISGPLTNFASIYKKAYVPLLITDGNATLGRDYTFQAAQIDAPTFLLAVGDTLSYEDLSLEQVNVNRYAYLDNKFPVELILKYTGDLAVKSKLQILSNDRIIHSEQVDFNKNSGGKVVTVFLPAKKVGINQFSAKIVPLQDEINKVNNLRNFAVEVIDQKAKIAIIYSYMHPDLGAYKNAIQSNRLREVSLISVNDFDVTTMSDYDLLLLFEPTSAFAKIYNVLKKSNANRFTVLGDHTDYGFLNRNQNTFNAEPTGQSDVVRPRLNPNFSAFLTENLDFSDFPPVVSNFGPLQVRGNKDVLLYKNIAGVPTQDPLIAVTELDGRREVLLAARDIWQWRAQSYLNTGTFENFDNFIDKLVQYAASRNKRSQLHIDYDSFYYGSDQSIISAQYVDKNYVFDPKAKLVMKVKEKKGNALTELPLILKNNRYEVNLNPLEPGDYDFTIQVVGTDIKSSGSFTIIPYDVERQAQNADWPKIQATAVQTNGMATTLKNQDKLIDKLLNDPRYVPVQKKVTKSVSLINFEFLLFIIIASLAIEWFVRKYNGLL